MSYPSEIFDSRDDENLKSLTRISQNHSSLLNNSFMGDLESSHLQGMHAIYRIRRAIDNSGHFSSSSDKVLTQCFDAIWRESSLTTKYAYLAIIEMAQKMWSF